MIIKFYIELNTLYKSTKAKHKGYTLSLSHSAQNYEKEVRQQLIEANKKKAASTIRYGDTNISDIILNPEYTRQLLNPLSHIQQKQDQTLVKREDSWRL